MFKLKISLLMGICALTLTHISLGFAQDDISEEEQQRRKDVELFKMKDQSGETYYEQRSNIGLQVGYFGSVYDPTGNSGFGIQDGGVQVGIEYNYQISPEFYLGGFGKWATLDDIDINYFPFGVQASYYAAPIFYIGGKTGLVFSSLDGDVSTSLLLGGHFGFDFRVAEAVSIAAEADLPFFTASPSFWAMGFLAKLKIWL